MVTPANNNYAPPKSVVADVPLDGDAPRKASRGSRFAAALIDGLLFGLPFVPSYMIAIPALTRRGAPPTALAIGAAVLASGFWIFAALVVVVCIAVITGILVYKNGQTIGKKWLGIKVVRKDGSRAGLARIFWVRYLLNSVIGYALGIIIPVIGRSYVLVDLLFIFGPATRCLHDYIADTIVVEA